MFDDRLTAALGDRRALADLAGNTETESRIIGCRKLVVAAAWADAHSEVDHPDGGVLVERLIMLGAAGTPLVAEFAPQGLVSPFDCSSQAARSWIGDALTIRHRLPRLWDRVVAGEIHHWKAREIAKLTWHLNIHVAGQVDEEITGWVEQLPWASFLRALDAAMLQADEKTYQERERIAAANREVRATQSEAGLRTLIARGEAGDVAMMMALYQRVAECLADEGDEDPLPVRMSKAMGWIANPDRVRDLLARHAADPDPHEEPWEKVAAHQADETDPWADDLPPAGWETARHGNFHQPGFDDDGWWDTPGADQHHTDHDPHADWPEDLPIDDEDLDWYLRRHHNAESAETDAPPQPPDTEPSTASPSGPAACTCGADTQVTVRWPHAFRPPGWRPLSPAQLAACAPTVNLTVHLTDQTLFDSHGVVRTDAGPILLEQLKRFLVQHDAIIKVYPVIDPAATASADAYEAPLRLRRAMAVRNPRSVFPHSPTTTRMDLDQHPRLPERRATRPDRHAFPRTPRPQRTPRQNHRALAVPTTRAPHPPLAIARTLDHDHHQPGHPRPRSHRLRPTPLGRSSLKRTGAAARSLLTAHSRLWLSAWVNPTPWQCRREPIPGS